ncbi:MAG: J domain-containing protein [Candidatus Eremiobacteraeota bacterium]|nr:J domain-containing protein [Candidatus Eremiobacteraeota bacterium]
MDYKDYYKILGVDKNSAEKDIKKAYRKLARQYHPDVNPQDKASESKFKEINEAYEVLGDKEKRAQYDQLGPYFQGGKIPEDMFRQYGQRGSSRGRGGGAHFDYNDLGSFQGAGTGDMGGFSDFFNMFFGGGGGGSSRAGGKQPRGGYSSTINLEDILGGQSFARASSKRAQPQIQELALELSLEEAAFGTNRLLQAEKQMPCDKCQGSGSVNGKPCMECRGGGFRTKPTTLEVKIPAGVKNGSRIKVEDFLLVVRIKPHHFFELKGNDLYCEVPVTITEAVLGGEIDIPTLKGTISTKIAPETQAGKTLRFTGQGMPVLKGEPGNLYAKIKVVIPSKIDAKEKKLFEELGKLVRENPRKDLYRRK